MFFWGASPSWLRRWLITRHFSEIERLARFAIAHEREREKRRIDAATIEDGEVTLSWLA
jgi:hypothetical protein